MKKENIIILFMAMILASIAQALIERGVDPFACVGIILVISIEYTRCFYKDFKN